jgi:L-threonylcarbamoyladenylate synthase
MTAEPRTRMIEAGPEAIAAAADCLRAGGLVAFPTETVYGLGADATNGPAVARLYAAKGRPAFNPLISHVADAGAAERLAVFNDDARRLAAAFWPGPLTLVLPKAPGCPVSDLALAGLDTIALRVPAHPTARALIAAFGKPIVAPSANRSGHVSPTTAQHAMGDLRGRIDLIVDGGAAPVGVESTIVACLDTPTLLRPGGVAREDIARVLGKPLESDETPDDDAPLAPGMMTSHYAPKAALRLNAREPREGETLLAFGPHAGAAMNLSPGGDLIEAAANLFSHLRALDAAGARAIAVSPIPRDGLGEAINDRLARAAAPRP